MVDDGVEKLAYATRRKEWGSISEAKTILIKARALFPKHYLIAYNSACYECHLGNLKKAMEFLGGAIDLAGKKDIRTSLINAEPVAWSWTVIRGLNKVKGQAARATRGQPAPFTLRFRLRLVLP